MKRSSNNKIAEASRQIVQLQQHINYDTRDYPIEYLVKNYDNHSFFKPDYQRNAHVWNEDYKVRFIESLILDYPIPLIFLSDTNSGKLEIVDGLQRISTLSEFLNNTLELNKLKKLTKLNGFRMLDLPENEQYRLKNSSLRVIVLKVGTKEATRIDLFNRINTSTLEANPSEIRSGSQKLNPVMQLVEKLSKDKLFLSIIDLSESKLQRKENLEFASRFFAYSHNYLKFSHSVKSFVDTFFKDFEDIYNKETKQELEDEFLNTFKFIKDNFPDGIFKNKTNQTPRVRFEALSVGTNLALKKNKYLHITKADISELVESDSFRQLTTSDGSNSKSRVKKRIEYVRNFLLQRSDDNE